jgi:hypothetical protein
MAGSWLSLDKGGAGEGLDDTSGVGLAFVPKTFSAPSLVRRAFRRGRIAVAVGTERKVDGPMWLTSTSTGSTPIVVTDNTVDGPLTARGTSRFPSTTANRTP